MLQSVLRRVRKEPPGAVPLTQGNGARGATRPTNYSGPPGAAPLKQKLESRYLVSYDELFRAPDAAPLKPAPVENGMNGKYGRDGLGERVLPKSIRRSVRRARW